MATIKTAISLYDGVTGPMRSMVKVMGVPIPEAIKKAIEVLQQKGSEDNGGSDL